MLKLKGIHHVAIISSNYEVSKQFYTSILGFQLIKETFRAGRNSYKADLSLDGQYIIELFSFPTPPKRLTQPEATGLRHIAFEVTDLDAAHNILLNKNVVVEEIRTDEITGKRFCFFYDPDNLPIELYEQ